MYAIMWNIEMSDLVSFFFGAYFDDRICQNTYRLHTHISYVYRMHLHGRRQHSVQPFMLTMI